MPGPSNTLLLERSFEEHADELAIYFDGIKKKKEKKSREIANVQSEITADIASYPEEGFACCSISRRARTRPDIYSWLRKEETLTLRTCSLHMTERVTKHRQ